jgi:hypothetical protein
MGVRQHGCAFAAEHAIELEFVLGLYGDEFPLQVRAVGVTVSDEIFFQPCSYGFIQELSSNWQPPDTHGDLGANGLPRSRRS